MNRSELIKTLADEERISAEEAASVVSIFFNSMKKTLLDGGRVEIRGFGSFKVKIYEGYAGRNPKTGYKVNVEAKKLPFFKAGKELKEFINS